jgi:hypothetical protein
MIEILNKSESNCVRKMGLLRRTRCVKYMIVKYGSRMIRLEPIPDYISLDFDKSR